MTTEEVEELREFVFKIVMLGSAAVGKTSLINMYCEGAFQEDYKPTLGANIVRKDVNLNSTKVRLIMWDLAGQEKYRVVRSMYFQGCQGALLVYDVTRYSTFDSINSKWLRDFKKYVKKEGTYILIGNKTDLNREVDKDMAEKKAKELGVEYYETSAKLNQNVDKAFESLSIQILNNLK